MSTFDTITGEFLYENSNTPTHMDGNFTDGDDYTFGGGGFGEGNPGFYMWRMRDNNHRKIADLPTGGEHTSCRNYHDRFETYGGTGAGTTSGHRYVMRSKYGGPRGIMGIRCGRNDMNQVRYLCNHRSVRDDGANEQHPGYDPLMRSFVFNSNWREPGHSSTDNEQVQSYVGLIPDAWQSPNNDGS
jgi:hypothetical protein